MQQAKVPVISALGSGLRGLVQLLDGAALVAQSGHRTAAHHRRTRSTGGEPDRLLQPEAGRARIASSTTCMIDAYGEPGEDYPISMENRLDRMPRITVDEVLIACATLEVRVRRHRTETGAYPPPPHSAADRVAVRVRRQRGESGPNS